ncbi:MAG: PAS domain-containing protein [Candidatus Hydrogenedens sp.]|nr:PAS domain-containing protein [Candidatus Hydrogenedens sp.]
MASGVVRIIVLLLASLGTQRISQPDMALWLLTGLFLAALACSVWFLITVRFQRTASPTLIWTQVLLDFSIVAATLSYTGGWSSYFSFLFVVVILEAGMLMGFFHGFVFALLAMGYTFFLQTPEPFKDLQMLPSWYTLMLQMTALFLTALISGHWNERINRLKHFQREILDNMVSGFLFCDLDGRISIANKAACTILDMTESELVGRNTSDTPLSGTGEECPVAIALRTGRDYVNYEYMVETAQKSNQVIELTTHKMLNRKHRIQALIVTFQDITEITEMRLTLQRHDRLAAVGESATELTHEIRNPLTSLQSAVEELQSNLSDTSLTQRLCGIVLRESRHLNSIVTSFLDFSRNPEMKREKIEVSPFLDAIRSSLMKRYPKIEVKVIREDGPSYIQADPVQMRQLCDNILTNSVESMEGQGLIEIEVSDREQLVELAFHDTGCGIAPDTIPHLFDPFYTAKKQGIGMGLAVCLRIVTAHDGDIQAVPRTGGGTSIIVRLPRRSE